MFVLLQAVNAALKFVANATGLSAEQLKQQGVTEDLLKYHVTEGAALLRSNLTNNQSLEMLDGSNTTITM